MSVTASKTTNKRFARYKRTTNKCFARYERTTNKRFARYERTSSFDLRLYLDYIFDTLETSTKPMAPATCICMSPPPLTTQMNSM